MTFDSEDVEDPMRRGFHAVESLDEASLRPGMGLQRRVRRADVESVTYVLSGALIHQDSSGGVGRQEAGEFHRASGSQEESRVINGSLVNCAQIIQISIAADGSEPDLKPADEQKRFLVAERRGLLRLIASSNGREASLRMHQDVRIYSSLLDPGTHLIHELRHGRSAWLQVVTGRVVMIEHCLRAGDGAALVDEAAVSLTAREASEILLFDLA